MTRLVLTLILLLAVFAFGYWRGNTEARGEPQAPRIAVYPTSEDYQPIAVPWRPVHAPTPSRPVPAKATARVRAPAVSMSAHPTSGTASWYWNGPGEYA